MHEHHHDAAVDHLPTFESPEMVAYTELEGEVLGGLVLLDGLEAAMGAVEEHHLA